MKRVVREGGRILEYTLYRSHRQSVLFKALPKGETRVYAPSWMHLRDVDRMVRERAEELTRMHESLDRELAQKNAENPVRDGCSVRLEGRVYVLHLREGSRVALRIAENELVLTLPHSDDTEAVRAALKRKLSELALKRIRQRLDLYAPRIGVTFGRVAIRDQKSRWGSCSSKQNLNFNWKLIMAPPEALDYVVIHELCHLIEFNHSPRFWGFVERQMPEYKVWKKWFKDHGDELNV